MRSKRCRRRCSCTRRCAHGCEGSAGCGVRACAGVQWQRKRRQQRRPVACCSHDGLSRRIKLSWARQRQRTGVFVTASVAPRVPRVDSLWRVAFACLRHRGVQRRRQWRYGFGWIRRFRAACFCKLARQLHKQRRPQRPCPCWNPSGLQCRCQRLWQHGQHSQQRRAFPRFNWPWTSGLRHGAGHAWSCFHACIRSAAAATRICSRTRQLWHAHAHAYAHAQLWWHAKHDGRWNGHAHADAAECSRRQWRVRVRSWTRACILAAA